MHKTLSLFIFEISKCDEFKEGQMVNPSECNMDGKLAFVGNSKLEHIYKHTTKVKFLAPAIDIERVYNENTLTDVDNPKEPSWLEKELGEEYKEKKNIRIKDEKDADGNIVFLIDGRELHVTQKELLTSYMKSEYSDTIVANYKEIYGNSFDVRNRTLEELSVLTDNIGNLVANKNLVIDIFEVFMSRTEAENLVNNIWRDNCVLIIK